MSSVLPNGLTYTVEIAFPASASFGNAFLLNDPVRGVLDNVTYTLGGNVWADVTADVISVSTSRGRNRELDNFNAGTATIDLRNNERQYDVTNTAGTYYGGILPRLPVRVTVEGTVIFNGYVEDYDYGYSNPSESLDFSTISIKAVDGFSILASTYLAAYTNTAQGSGARVTAVLDRPEVNFPFTRSIATGSSTLGTDAVAEGTVALDYLNQVATAEQGYLFCAGDGTLTFKGRNDTVSIASEMAFADTGTGTAIPFSGFEVQYGTELLYNRVVSSRTGGTTYTVNSTTSQAQYLTIGLVYDNLLVSTDSQAENIGTYLLGKYSEPEFRFASLELTLAELDSWTTEPLSLEIADTITITKKWRTGTPATVTKTCAVEGIDHRIDLGGHKMTIKLGGVDNRVFLRLDNLEFGQLDSNLLGF
jgi:hypothetical protein